MSVEKLQIGITAAERILEDARKVEEKKLERINLLSRRDVNFYKIFTTFRLDSDKCNA
jgi:hypothetical protein